MAEKLKNILIPHVVVYTNIMTENKDTLKSLKDLFNNPKWFANFEKQFEKQVKTAYGSFDKNFKNAIGSFNLITSKDIQKLEKRVAALEKKIAKLEKPAGATVKKKTAVRKNAPKSTATKAAASKSKASTKKTVKK